MDLTIQKAVELGVAAVQPILAERTVVRLKGFDVVLDLFAVGVAHVQQELVLGGEELPVDEILDRPPADGDDLRAGAEAEFGPEGVRVD